MLNRDEQWARMIGGAYKDAQIIGNYKVEYTHDGDDERILIWNPERPCISMFVDKKEKLGVFESAEYSPTCTIDGKMQRGEGTRKLIQFAIDLLKSRGVNRIEMMDTSTVVCNGKKIQLAPMYFFKYGQTWYEKYFGFKPIPPYDTEYFEMKHNRIKYLDVEFLEKQPCDYFTREVIQDLMKRIGFVFFYNMGWFL